MNGSIVFLRADDPDEEEIVVDTDEGDSLTIPYGETATLRLAYAISVHKAQGCEVPVVVGVCHRSHSRMLSRPLLYTAITRARNSLRADRRLAPCWARRCAGATAAAATSGLAERLREIKPPDPLAEIGITLAGVALLAGLVFAVPELHEAALAAIHGETERSKARSPASASPGRC